MQGMLARGRHSEPSPRTARDEGVGVEGECSALPLCAPAPATGGPGAPSRLGRRPGPAGARRVPPRDAQIQPNPPLPRAETLGAHVTHPKSEASRRAPWNRGQAHWAERPVPCGVGPSRSTYCPRENQPAAVSPGGLGSRPRTPPRRPLWGGGALERAGGSDTVPPGPLPRRKPFPRGSGKTKAPRAAFSKRPRWD